MNALDAFQPAVRKWFQEKLGEPSAPQELGWPHICAGKNVLLAAPTGSGKTLAAFLWALDRLLRQGRDLPSTTQVLYVSPLKALSNDIQKNLRGPLDELAAEDLFLPEIRVQVRTGDTTPKDRQAMTKKPPHILVTTPESLYILLTSQGGRRMLATVKTLIVDEIHALARDKRGSHLALSMERLEALCGPVQRIGLSATQKPLADTARLLVGVDRACEIADAGHLRELDVAIEVPPSPLTAVCSHEQWEEIYARMGELIQQHRTTLIFSNTRAMAERIAARLTNVLGPEQVTCHHGSLSKDQRLDAEQRLKAGTLRALVATASLELGIDIGDVDLSIQIGSGRSIATFLQRVGRAGHGKGRIPKGRLFPLTLDELAEAAALVRAVRKGELDRTPQPRKPLDILAQQIVAECVNETWHEDALYALCKRAAPYQDLTREEFNACVKLHCEGRHALLHRDGINRRLRATKRARITAVTGGGAIPDTALYRVMQDPDGTFIGTLDEDFSIESTAGDIFQLGNTAWRIVRVESRVGIVRVVDAHGQPPTIPFWLGEAPSRTIELSSAVAQLREDYLKARGAGAEPQQAEKISQSSAANASRRGPLDPCRTLRGAAWVAQQSGTSEGAALQIAEYFEAGYAALGAMPTQQRVIAERFFDESGGMQLVIHAPFGGRINRAWGLALRKRFCRGFGFELQAAANEDALLISLGPQHSFPLESVFDFLHPNSAMRILTQALLDQPMFEVRWRWNVTRSLLVERSRGGRRVPAPLLRMRAGDELVKAFPHATACPETLRQGDIEPPMDHPLVRQTIEDCLHEAMDADGFLDLVKGLSDGSIEHRAVDTVEPSAFARAILSAKPYAFLDDAPLEERRTWAVQSRRVLDVKNADEVGALDPAAIQRVREEAWPKPDNLEELHEALLWMGYVTAHEAQVNGWLPWLETLAAGGRVVLEPLPELLRADHAEYPESPRLTPEEFALQEKQWPSTLESQNPFQPLALESSTARADRVTVPEASRKAYFAAEVVREPKALLRGRLETLSPVFYSMHHPLMLELETAGIVLRGRFEGRAGWCNRRLLARIHRYTLDRLRQDIQPVSSAEFLRFLACWQHVDDEHQLEGPRGVQQVIEQLAGFEVPSAQWEACVLPMRVRDYRREWLDQLTLSGEVAWGRLWTKDAASTVPIRVTPVALVPREQLDTWQALSAYQAAPRAPGGRSAGSDGAVLLGFDEACLSGYARTILKILQARGAVFPPELHKLAGLLPAHFERGLSELIAQGLITCDAFAGLRQLIVPPSRRRQPVKSIGRWSLLSTSLSSGWSGAGSEGEALVQKSAEALYEFCARQLLKRTGVVFRKTIAREKLPVPWRDILRVYRRMELRGELRGGRFVAGFDGEQYALPEAVEMLRRIRKREDKPVLQVAAADPLNYQGILTREVRVSPLTRTKVRVG